MANKRKRCVRPFPTFCRATPLMAPVNAGARCLDERARSPGSGVAGTIGPNQRRPGMEGLLLQLAL